MEHGVLAHASRPFDELVHVPLLVKLPAGASAGRRVGQHVGLADLAPTLLDLVGVDPLGDVDGESFLGVLRGTEESFEPRVRFMEYINTIGLRNERWKYIHPQRGAPELFDLIEDPAELVDRLADYPDVAGEMKALVDAAVIMREATKTGERVKVDPETVDALKALGYL